MSSYTITVVETIGIQGYVFGSNRLQENIGASELVWRATGEWALEEVQKVAPTNNVANTAKRNLDDEFKIEEKTEPGSAEVLYTGGGNVVVLFREHSAAVAFAFGLTDRALREAPGLHLVVAHTQNFDFDNPNYLLDRAVRDLLGSHLAHEKASTLPSSPLLGLGVTAACSSTGSPATETNKGLRLSKDEPLTTLSREVATRRQYKGKAKSRLDKLLTEEARRAFEFPTQLDHLGRELGQESYVAVVHADGNGVGATMREIGNDYMRVSDHDAKTQNRRYIDEVRSFSQRLEKAAICALEDVVKVIIRNHSSGKIPFRPLVFGGDDVTFVCRGNLGVPLAVEYLNAFERRAAEFLAPRKLFASAGIAIVKLHYPFSRAYRLSEELTKSSKKFLRNNDLKASALDWHFATSGLSGSLGEIREREFQVPSGSLVLRPLLLREEHDSEGPAWLERVEKLVVSLQDDPAWSEKRNKVKTLREALREGEQKVKNFRRDFLNNELLPGFEPGDRYQETGWFSRRCGYFDAIELYDHYVSLEDAEFDEIDGREGQGENDGE